MCDLDDEIAHQEERINDYKRLYDVSKTEERRDSTLDLIISATNLLSKLRDHKCIFILFLKNKPYC